MKNHMTTTGEEHPAHQHRSPAEIADEKARAQGSLPGAAPVPEPRPCAPDNQKQPTSAPLSPKARRCQP